jgi:hypothetical protein
LEEYVMCLVKRRSPWCQFLGHCQFLIFNTKILDVAIDTILIWILFLENNGY